MAHTLPTRSQVDPANTWAITDLYPSDQAWREACENVRGLVRDLAAYRGRLGESAATLLAFLRLQDEIDLQGDRMISYAFRKSDEDTRNPVYQEMSAQAQNFLVELSQALSFQTPELLAIEDATLESFYAQEPALAHYRLMLKRIRSKKEHTLSPDCEALLASAERMGQAPDDIFSLLNDADMTYPDATDSKGETHPVTHGNYVALLQSADRTLRQSAFQSLYSVYGQFRNTCAAILGAQMKQLQFFADARRYPSALHAALAETEVDPQIYHNLIQTVHDNLDAMHRYVRLRKKLLGVDKLHYYDLYTPIVADEDASIPFEQGKEMAREALKPLGEDYLKILNEGFDNRWIDVYENQGKRSGAYSAGVYGVHPYVLLNYTDTLDDVFTLVHEMGHALHSYLSNHTQSVTYAGYKIFVAEVASTCNEALLMQHLLSKTIEPKRRAYLINHFLEQFRGTLYRQTMFAEFELWCSEQTRKGQPLTAESLNEKYAELNRLYYGEDIEPDPEIALEWARIPHFYYNFYVYQYATGFTSAIALSQRILKEGRPAVEDYLRFLSGGCSADPVSLLKGAGVDISSPAPIVDALKLFDTFIGEMEQLMQS
ncbi:MAG: oligoendopeptidase F [Pseudoflavonifractor capillosus]|uniref:oligoendopeptidase F n=1 Tax=Pseudoflavonifractor capillosus TaxID=106588 RepID=UPI0023F7EFB3|nr:oligoendopeptidase F [Pseudoflavonifractor capillosus]MCI5928182.1 oligoendopeptidase F [Pseudoflavonifractor capillosus]MDY4659863.1 oligoendopeptidase F [Pseudoflavonifractor capillosus]